MATLGENLLFLAPPGLYVHSFWALHTAASYTKQGYGPNPGYLPWHIKPLRIQPLTGSALSHLSH